MRNSENNCQNNFFIYNLVTLMMKQVYDPFLVKIMSLFCEDYACMS